MQDIIHDVTFYSHFHLITIQRPLNCDTGLCNRKEPAADYDNVTAALLAGKKTAGRRHDHLRHLRHTCH